MGLNFSPGGGGDYIRIQKQKGSFLQSWARVIFLSRVAVSCSFFHIFPRHRRFASHIVLFQTLHKKISHYKFLAFKHFFNANTHAQPANTSPRQSTFTPTAVVDSVLWIRIRILVGSVLKNFLDHSGSVFGIRIRIRTCIKLRDSFDKTKL